MVKGRLGSFVLSASSPDLRPPAPWGLARGAELGVADAESRESRRLGYGHGYAKVPTNGDVAGRG
jgi:hypothetical protein